MTRRGRTGLRSALVVCVLVLYLAAGVVAALGTVTGSVTVTVRILAPELDLTVAGVAPGGFYSTPVTPEATSSDPSASFYATLNGQFFSLGTPVFAEGTHTLIVTAFNKGGEMVTQAITFVIDYSPPYIVIDGVLDGGHYNHPVYPTARTDDGAHLEFLLNGQPYEPGSEITGDGHYVLEVTATDGSGNTTTATVGFTIDTVPPDLTVGGVEDGQVYNAPVQPWAFSSDPDAMVVAGLDGKLFNLGDTIIGPGSFVLRVIATDRAGNTTQEMRSFVIEYPATALDILLEARPNGRSIDLSWQAGPEPVTSAGYRIVRSTSLPALVTAAPHDETDGTLYSDTRVSASTRYYYRVLAVDAAGEVIGVSNIVDMMLRTQVKRVGGSDRLMTAVETSRDTFRSSDAVILATGSDFADALASAGLAGSYRAPILLTNPTHLPAATSREIERLGASRVIIVGGPRAVDGSIEASLKRSGLAVMRLSGSDRYGTAVAIAREIERNEARQGRARTSQVFLARGDQFPDALSVSPLAYALRAPVLLTTPNSLPAVVESYVTGRGYRSAVIAGGTSAVSEDVAQRFARAGGMSIVRRGGSDRYATSGAVSSYGVDRGWASWGGIGIATGTNFPDALSGSVAVGELGGVLLVTPPDDLHSSARSRLIENRADVFDVRIFGGTRAVSESVETTVRGIIR